jgi:hypothetical protein
VDIIAGFPGKLSEFPGIGEIPTLRELANLEVDLLPTIEDRLGLEVTPGESAWLARLRQLITKASGGPGTRIAEDRTAGPAIKRTRPYGV